MNRITVRLPEKHVEEIEQLVDEGNYPNRSEAIREGVRDLLADDQPRDRFAGQKTGTIAGMDTYHDWGES